MSMAQLADHFQQRELSRSNGRIAFSTKKAYQGYINKWTVPRWGDYLLPNIKAVEVAEAHEMHSARVHKLDKIVEGLCHSVISDRPAGLQSVALPVAGGVADGK